MNTQRYAELSKALDQILDTLIAQYHPEKVILFGSMATGDVHAWSDLDLAIIKDTSQPFYQRLKEVALLSPVWVGVDYLVYTPSEFAAMIAEQNPFILKEVIHKGMVIYERDLAKAVAWCAWSTSIIFPRVIRRASPVV